MSGDGDAWCDQDVTQPTACRDPEPSAVASSNVAAPRPDPAPTRDVVFDAQATSRCITATFRAVRDVTLPIVAQRDHRADRPVRLRQDHVPALPEPDERPDRRRPRRGQDPVPRRRPLRRRRRPGRGAPADRHGVPEAEPVPEVDLRQRRLRPEDRRASRATWTSSSSSRLAQGRACGTRSRTS